MQKILEKMCLTPVATVSKKREYWKLGEFTITIDTVEGVGTFVEIEIEGDESVEERLKEFVSEIVPEGRVVDKTYLEMVIENEKT
jgi:adenylate cyclase class 2